jgi:hypothetical protein
MLLLLAAPGVAAGAASVQGISGQQYVDLALPEDYLTKHEWTRASLRYRDFNGRAPAGFRYRRSGSWTTDYPRFDRHLLEGVRRLTVIDSRSVERPVDLDGQDDIYNWPFSGGRYRGAAAWHDVRSGWLRTAIIRRK